MKNLQKTISVIFFLLVSYFGISQNSIEGTVTDQSNDAVFFATAVLYNAQDSTVIEAETTDDNGNYQMNDVKEGNYYIVVSMLGFLDGVKTDITVPADDLTFDFKLATAENLLTTVEVTAKLPLLEQRGDKLIVNVENNITNTGGSLIDVMKKVPGMIVVQDRLSMAGAGTPTILLNGKSTSYMDVQSLLKDIPGDNVKKIEIIHQPGAEYEAAGNGPIINIILKKNSLFGTNGSVHVAAGKGELWDYNTGISLSHYEGNFNISGGLGYSKNSWIDILEVNRRLTNIGKEIDGTYSQVNRDAMTPNTFRGNLRMDWDVTEKHRFGMDTKFYTNSNNRIATNETLVDLYDTDQKDYTLTTNNDIKRSWNSFTLNPYYIFEIDTSGQKLELDLNYTQYKRDGYNTLNTTNNFDSNQAIQKYTQPGDTKIVATTIDYTKPLSKNFELKMGAKYSMADLDNDLQSEYVMENGEWANNDQQSNHYLFEEIIYAGYGKLNWNAGQWSGTAGLRYENSQSTGTSLTLDTTLTRDISKLFPSFSVSRKLGEKLTSTVAYSYRIDRPRYSTLNPFVYYLDPFTSLRGNPTIRPELTHSTKFTLSYQGQPFFNVEYKKSNDAIVQVTEQDPESEEGFKTDVNFDNKDVWSGSLFFPLSFIPKLGGYAGVIMTNKNYQSNYIGETFDVNKWNTTLFFQAEFKLPADINAELGGWYTSSNQEGIFQSEHLYGSSFGISKKFLNNKAKISLGVEDFVSRYWFANVDYQQDTDIASKWQTPVVNMKFKYKFGNQHLKSKQKRSGSASEEINRAKQD